MRGLIMGLVLLVGAGSAVAQAPALFETADRCMACHNDLSTPAGEDISIGVDWRASMMANAARDPYWQAAVRREVQDHPQLRGAIEDKCSTCHMPMARYEAHAAGGQGTVFGNTPVGQGMTRANVLAADGASCSACHQIQPDNLGEASSFTGGFMVDEAAVEGRPLFGPFAVDGGRARVMRSATGFEPTAASHIQSSELCATCHTLYTHAYNEAGEEVGQLPEQVPYLEWRHSAYPGSRSCQSCHMPVVEQPTPVTGVLPRDHENVSRHVFRGGNFFMPRILNRYRDELGVVAGPQELDVVSARTREHLARTARVTVESAGRVDDRLDVALRIESRAGHKLPTAYPSRRAWLHVTVTDAGGGVVFESGAIRPDGSIQGNDNDADPGRYEPHYRVIRTPDQVQIYEAIMVGADGGVTTGLLTGVRYAKDNRILPRGFDKATAGADIAVHGAASDDDGFTDAGHAVRYEVDVAGATAPLTVTAELLYQPIGFRWARNLAGRDAMETDRFVRYYEEMAPVSSAVLGRAAVTVP